MGQGLLSKEIMPQLQGPDHRPTGHRHLIKELKHRRRRRQRERHETIGLIS